MPTLTALLHNLGDMLTYGRPAGSAMESAFIRQFVATLPGAYRDPYGNWHVRVGPSDPGILYSCHTDTVHRIGCRQRLQLTEDNQLTLKRRKSHCLGADDTVGVFLCCQLIRRGHPGHYVFHYGEEVGCQGSHDLADADPQWCQQFRIALAFDRKGTRDVITHQCGMRTASDAFAYSLADQLNAAGPLSYQPSNAGLYTDTDSYAALIPECSNLSIGYSAAHSDRESVSVDHVLTLLDALTVLDADALVVSRDPEEWVNRLSWQGWVYPDDHSTSPMIRASGICDYCGRLVDDWDLVSGGSGIVSCVDCDRATLQLCQRLH